MKRIILFLLIQTIALNYTYSQKNYIPVIDTDIELAYNKLIELDYYKALSDSLEAEIYKRDAIISKLKENGLNQLERDTLQSKVYYLLKEKYTSLQKDYNKLKKGNLLNGILGGEVGAVYNLDSKNVQSPYIALNIGLMFKRKYIVSAKVGFNLNKEIVFGLNGSMVF